MSDEYRTVLGVAEAKRVVKKSRFIALAKSVESATDVKAFLEDVCGRYPSATHYCYAYSIGCDTQKREYATDAGEPTHSAGPPILTVITHSGLSNLVCAVARYYGGINLGVGGLIRAYSGTARDCVSGARIVTRIFLERLQVQCPYDKIGAVLNLCNRLNAEVLDVQYDRQANVALQIRRGQVESLKESLDGIDANIVLSCSEGIAK